MKTKIKDILFMLWLSFVFYCLNFKKPQIAVLLYYITSGILIIYAITDMIVRGFDADKFIILCAYFSGITWCYIANDKSKYIIIFALLLPAFSNGQTHIYLSNESNIQSSMETYTVYDTAAILHKPEAATTGIAWLSYSDISQPACYDDTLVIDVNTAGEWQFYSFEVEKYFRIEIRTTDISGCRETRHPLKTVILYQFENFYICKYEQ